MLLLVITEVSESRNEWRGINMIGKDVKEESDDINKSISFSPSISLLPSWPVYGRGVRREDY